MNGYMENPVVDKLLTPFAEQLSPLLSQEELANQYKERRLVFNADFKRAMSAEIRPAIDALLQFASKQGHWVDINLLNDQRFVSYVHHAYTISWTRGGYTTITVVGNYDYDKVYFLVEHPEITFQMAYHLPQIKQDMLLAWIKGIFPFMY